MKTVEFHTFILHRKKKEEQSINHRNKENERKKKNYKFSNLSENQYLK